MILVTGANGTIGSALVRQLSNGGQPVRALVRDRAKGAQIAGPSVEIVVGDLSKPESLAPAFRNIERAFVLTFGSPDLTTLEGNAFRAAKNAGVRHVVKLSGIPVCVPEYAAEMPLARWHLESENELRASGVPWTKADKMAFTRPAVVELLGRARTADQWIRDNIASLRG
jgi:(4-alkanoyl-5-oxo-2,5-dihydrofuran-3-yl)methyl phosphate reductase